MKASRGLQAQIKEFEGLRLAPYSDGPGVSIGYGHYLGAGSQGMGHRTITKLEAESYFIQDLLKAEADVNDLVNVSLNQDQFDSLVDFRYNLGRKNLQTSTLLKKVNAKAPASEIRTEFLKWNKAKIDGVLQPLAGLTTRRTWEADQFQGVNLGILRISKTQAKNGAVILGLIIVVIVVILVIRKFRKK